MLNDLNRLRLDIMRSLVQYDFHESTPSFELQPPSDGRRPPVKKRKRNHRNPQKSKKIPIQHWDDPGSAAVGMIYDEQEASTAPSVSVNPSVGSVKVAASADDLREEEEEYGEVIEGDYAGEEEEEEESRELTHGEIWDDSALIDAWNSAEAEYKTYHGTSKSWKTEPVKRSPLWYNKPCTVPSKSNAGPAQEQEDGELDPDTAPLDFDTFVPTHDPSLFIPTDGAAANPSVTPFFVPPASTTMVSRDEAFNNALSAMYWCGYWTAVYQSQSQTHGNVPGEAIKENGVEVDEDDDEEDLVPAQR